MSVSLKRRSSSCIDINASQLLVLTDVDEDYDGSSSDDDDSFIEIAIGNTPVLEENHDMDEGDEDMELRSYFSSRSAPFSQIILSTETDSCTISTTPTSAAAAAATTFAVKSCNTASLTPEDDEPDPSYRIQECSTLKPKLLQFSAISRLFKIFTSNLKVSNSSSDIKPTNHLVALDKCRCIDKGKREEDSNIKTRTNGGSLMTKLMIAFRALKTGRVVTYMVKPNPLAGKSTREERKPDGAYRRLMKPFDKRLIERAGKRVLEMNLGGVRWVLGGMSVTKVQSYPSSNESSPITKPFPAHTSDNSVQAAIAHCKRSYHMNP